MQTADSQSDRFAVFADPPEVVHIGYSVTNLRSAIEHWTGVLGAGPFFIHENIVFDLLDRPGGDAVFDHSCAFGQWGNLTVELHEIYKLEPAETLEPALSGSKDGFNHIAYFVADLGEETERLESLGIPLVLRIGVGSVESRLHYAPWLGHSLELHLDTGHVRERHEMFAEAARGWDGSDPIRPMPGRPGH